MTKTYEVNFDGLVGPTHNYGGLSLGNLASISHGGRISNPKAAAMQGLKKMHLLWSLGIPQAVLPPHERPNLTLLRNLGFVGNDHQILEKAYHYSKPIFNAIFSSSSMWAANAALVSPSQDTKDHKVHFTPANLQTHFHRAQECETTTQILKKIFANEDKFIIHNPLPSYRPFSDEGAANHNRLVKEHGCQGIEIFVYGREAFKNIKENFLFPARQTLEASQAIMRRHQLLLDNTIFVKQNPLAIEQGVFHNDVASVMNENVFFYHEDAFLNTPVFINTLKEKATFPLFLLPVSSQELSLPDAVRTYLFNSQIVTLPNRSMMLILPEECRSEKKVENILSRIVDHDNPIKDFKFVDCRQSMQNGGGPACLRLRIVLTDEEKDACLQNVFFDDKLYHQLVHWVEKYYRDKLSPEDLLDPLLLIESREALSALCDILGFGSLYSFQK